jgi:hypothetical protein
MHLYSQLWSDAMARVGTGGGADAPMAGLHCAGCGSDEVIAIEPGTESERVAGIVVRRGRPMRAWCAKCWQRRWISKP